MSVGPLSRGASDHMYHVIYQYKHCKHPFHPRAVSEIVDVLWSSSSEQFAIHGTKTIIKTRREEWQHALDILRLSAKVHKSRQSSPVRRGLQRKQCFLHHLNGARQARRQRQQLTRLNRTSRLMRITIEYTSVARHFNHRQRRA